MLDTLVDNRAGGADKEINHNQSLEIEMKRCLKTLTDRERNIVCSFFGIGYPEALSLGEIATKYNMSGERVRQIKDKAIRHSRDPRKAKLLRKYL